MDEYSEFGADDFDVKGWINATVSSHVKLLQESGEEPESKELSLSVPPAVSPSTVASSSLDTHLSTVATKLQAVSASINAGLEKSMVEIMVSVPRIVTEVDRVETAIKTLHGDLSNLTGQLEEIDHGTNAHVETLARLDLVKTNMGDCLHTLTEAASWNALVREVITRFGQDDLKGVAERLEAMVSSMGVLIHMPEAEDRAATLAELQEKLETLLQPKLREVLRKDRLGSLMEYAAMYRQLGRTDVFRAEYCKIKSAAAHKRWFASATSPVPGGGATTGTGAAITDWLPSFLEYLQGSLMDERKKTVDLFGSEKSPAVLCQVVVTAFQPLLGSFQKHLEAAPWPEAVSLLTEVLRFVDHALELSRGASERDLLAVLLSASAAFRPLQDTFRSHENRYLSTELQPLLETLDGVSAGRAGGSVGMAVAFTRRMEEVSEVSTKGFGVVQESAQRCAELTAGYQARDALKEASEALSSFLKAVRDAGQQSRSLGMGLLTPKEAKAPVSPDKTDPNLSSGNPGKDFGVESEEAFDWQFLEGALVLLGAAGRCQRRFAQVEEGFASVLLRQRTGLFVPSPPRLSELIPSANAGNMTATSQGSHSSTSGGVGTSNGVVGAGPEGSSEEERVALLRSALGRVRLEEDRAVRAEIRLALMSIAEPSSAMPGSVLPGPARDVRALAAEARSLVFDVCFAPVATRLNTVSSLPSWLEEDANHAGEWGDAGGDDMGEYDTVPQAYMTQVGEHLLTLLQNLEPFAGSDSFRDAAEPTEDLHLLTQASWRECGAALELGEAELMFLESLSGAKPPEDGVENPLYDEEDGDGEASGMAGDGAGGGQEDGEEANFCTAWLLCVGSGTAGCLLAKILSLPRLSERGVKHLGADLKYLVNVFHALDLAAPPILEHFTMLAAVGRDDVEGHMAQETVSGFGPAGVILAKLERRLAEMRGVSVS